MCANKAKCWVVGSLSNAVFTSLRLVTLSAQLAKSAAPLHRVDGLNMTTSLASHGLLHHNATYNVVICHECEYAIQRSAVDSHLLRHKIYRSERQRLLALVSQLQISEPDDVQLPPAGSHPIDGLPVIPGFACTATGCDSLCASSKRMRRHWSECHATSELPSSFARAVHIQTFFRGTKLRYFEVIPHKILDCNEVQGGRDGMANVISAPQEFPEFGLDLDILRYFHHFVTVTGGTLPADSMVYWQVDMVAQALLVDWLMHGLLAISAIHLATTSGNEKTIQEHREQTQRFLQKFQAGWKQREAEAESVGMGKEGKVAAQMMCILRCCQWTMKFADDRDSSPTLIPLDLLSLLLTINGSADGSFALQHAVHISAVTEETFSRLSSSAGQDPRASGPRTYTVPSVLLAHLRALPYRMAEVLGKPDNAGDVFASFSAIDALIRCCDRSFASKDASAVLMGMVSWPRMLSARFNRMVWHRDAAALIVLSQWALLLQREECHCWFLAGAATIVQQLVEIEVSGDQPIWRLVRDLALPSFGDV